MVPSRNGSGTESRGTAEGFQRRSNSMCGDRTSPLCKPTLKRAAKRGELKFLDCPNPTGPDYQRLGIPFRGRDTGTLTFRNSHGGIAFLSAHSPRLAARASASSR